MRIADLEEEVVVSSETAMQMMSLLSSWSWTRREVAQVPRPGAYSQELCGVSPLNLEDADIETAVVPALVEAWQEQKRGHRRNRSFGALNHSADKTVCVKKTRSEGARTTWTAAAAAAAATKRSSLVAISQLGHGSFGHVYLVADRALRKDARDARCLAALKAIPLKALNTRKKLEHVAFERRVLESLHDHPNVIGLKGAWRCPNALYLLTEVAWGGELFRHLQHKRRFEPRQVAFLAAEISSALEHAHRRRIAYRDLKPENVLLDDRGHVKLVDFGLSKILENDDTRLDATKGCRSLCGTPEYMSPETLSRQDYGYAVDYWALGMLCAELLSGLPPWYTSNRDELFRRIRCERLDLSAVSQAVVKGKTRGAPDPDMSDRAIQLRWQIAKEATGFIEALLDRDPVTRLGVSGDPSRHAFFRRFHLSGLEPRQLSALDPPYNPSTIAQLLTEQQQSKQEPCRPLPSSGGRYEFADQLWTNFGRANLVSIDVGDISVELAEQSHDDRLASAKVGTLADRSRAIRAWTYRRS